MMYVIVSEILVLSVIWPPSWIYGTHRCPMTSAVPLLKSVRGNHWNFLAIYCALKLEICLGVITVAGTRDKQLKIQWIFDLEEHRQDRPAKY